MCKTFFWNFFTRRKCVCVWNQFSTNNNIYNTYECDPMCYTIFALTFLLIRLRYRVLLHFSQNTTLILTGAPYISSPVFFRTLPFHLLFSSFLLWNDFYYFTIFIFFLCFFLKKSAALCAVEEREKKTRNRLWLCAFLYLKDRKKIVFKYIKKFFSLYFLFILTNFIVIQFLFFCLYSLNIQTD